MSRVTRLWTRSLLPLAIIATMAWTAGGGRAGIRSDPEAAAPANAAVRQTGSGEERWDIQWLGRLGGATTAVAVAGHRVYVSVGSSFLVMDATDPTHPQGLGRETLTQVGAETIAVVGDYAFLASPDAGLMVLDVSDPASPVRIGSSTPFPASDVAVTGTRAYLTDTGAGQLRAFEVTEPREPRELGVLALESSPTAVAVAGDVAIVALGAAGLRFVDLRDPAHMAVQSSLAGTAFDVAIAGRFAVVAAGEAGLRVVDIADPAQPALVGAVALERPTLTVTVAGNYAYAGPQGGAAAVVDIAAPAAPRLLSVLSAPEEPGCGMSRPDLAAAIAVSGSTAYVAGHTNGLLVADVANPEAPQVLTTVLDPFGCAMAVDVAGQYGYVAAHDAGLRVVESYGQRLVATVPIPYARDVAVVGQRAYVVDGNSLWVVDMARPAEPVTRSTLALPGTSTVGVTVVNNRAFVAGAYGGLRVVDVRDPSAPQVVGALDTAGTVWDVAVDGSYAYLADAVALRIVDGSSGTPVEIGELPVAGGFIRAVLVNAGVAYLADESGFLRIVDVSNPAAPRQLAALPSNAPTALARVDQRLYVAGADGYRIVDVSDPAAPRPSSASYDGGGVGIDVDDTHQRVYLAEAMNGLLVTDAHPLAPIEQAVLHGVGNRWAQPPFHCPVDVYRGGDRFLYSCGVAAGHFLRLSIERHADPTTAATAFATDAGELPLARFHGRPAFQRSGPGMPGTLREHVWLADRWVLRSEALDDTGIPVVPDPLELSEQVYSGALSQGMLRPLQQLWLPALARGSGP